MSTGRGDKAGMMPVLMLAISIWTRVDTAIRSLTLTDLCATEMRGIVVDLVSPELY